MPTAAASKRAMLVLPVPGGPHNIIEDNAFRAGEMLLSDYVVERSGAQTVCERRIGLGHVRVLPFSEKIGHQAAMARAAR
jgi:hypothetical protein